MRYASRLIWPLFSVVLLILLMQYAPQWLVQAGMSDTTFVWVSRGLAIVCWLVGAWLAAVLLDLFLWDGIVRRAINREPPRLIVQLTRLAVFMAAIGGILADVFDQSITAFWATSGAVGVIVGFALQNLILDTFSGLAIHLERPFKVGDWINVRTRMGEFIGRVEETNWRTTRLWTTARNIIIIPNSFMTTTIVMNYSLPTHYARFELELLMDFNVPTDRVLRVLDAAVKNAIGPDGPLADPPPKVRVDNITENGVIYKIRYFLDPEITSPSRARNNILGKALRHMHYSGISLTYPKRDVYLTNMPWRQKDWDFEKDQVKQLKRVPLFKVLTDEDLTYLSGQLKVKKFGPGQRVVTQGEPGESMFIIGEGMLQVSIMDEDGAPVAVATLEPGDFFGETSLLTGEARTATVTCTYDALVGEIRKEAIASLIDQNKDVAELLSLAMAKRTLENTSILERDDANNDDALEDEASRILASLKRFFRL